MAPSTMQPPPQPRTRRRRLLGAVILFLALAWFGGTAGVRWWVDRQVHRNDGRALPAFAVRDLAGVEVRDTSLRGRTVVLNFFRSRCPSCVAEAPAIRALAAELDPARYEVVGVITDAVLGFPAAETQATLDRMAYRHRVLRADAAMLQAFHGQGWAHVTPVTYVVDPEGRVVKSLRGHQDLAALRTAVRGG